MYFGSYEQACATAVYAAVSQEPLDFLLSGGGGGEGGEGGGGLYLEGCAVAGPAPKDAVDALEYGYAEWAFDADKEAKLWELSQRLVGTA